MYSFLFDFSHPTIGFLIIASYNLLKCKLNFWFLVQQKNPEAITSTFARKAEPTAHQHPLLKDLQQRFETTKQIAVPKTRDWASLFPGSRIPQLVPVLGAHLNLWTWSIRNSRGGQYRMLPTPPECSLPLNFLQKVKVPGCSWVHLTLCSFGGSSRSWSLGGRKTDNSYLLQKCQNESTEDNFSHFVSVGFLCPNRSC